MILKYISSMLDAESYLNRSLIPYWLLFCAVLTISGCASITSTGSVSASASAKWVVLPINNLSSAPLAHESAAALIETQLRQRGVSQVQRAVNNTPSNLAAILDNSGDLGQVMLEAKASGARFGITGDIHEWRYKNGIDKEPVVGLSLKLIDLSASTVSESMSAHVATHLTRVIWQASHTKTGWGFASLAGVADGVISDLLAQIKLTNSDAYLLSQQSSVE